MLHKAIKFFLDNKFVAFVLLFLMMAWGLMHAPFDFGLPIPSDPVSVDAIPDIGENQQIVFTEWEGQSPQDIEDQVTYPLTSRLLGIPGVKTIRSTSMFGFSSIYVIFEDGIDFYWSRSRILEKLNSLQPNLLPQGVQPRLGPDATALGQIFWYTLEGRDKAGNVTGGWDLHEIRTVQDFFVRNALSGVNGVAEVASIGGYEREYQVDIDPEILRQYKIGLLDVVRAIRDNNRAAGAKTLEINKVEYFIRGLGYVKSLKDIENIAVSSNGFTPILIKDIARVTLGPSERRGILDKGGAEVVGGVVVARFGANPMEVIRNIKRKIGEISPGLPSKTLSDGSRSQLTVVPFYDRSVLIGETLQTLENTLSTEILITLFVVIIMLFNLRVSLLISSLMPIVVLIVFIAMKYFNVDANILALSGIAIAIGTLVDMAIILTENIVRHLENSKGSLGNTIYTATKEVSGAILTAGLTTIISFIPVFSLTGAEGKLFTPLAFTKTVALFASMMVAFFIMPSLAAIGFREYRFKKTGFLAIHILFLAAGVILAAMGKLLFLAIIPFGILGLLKATGRISPEAYQKYLMPVSVLTVVVLLGIYWRPFGYAYGLAGNVLFVGAIAFLSMAFFTYFRKYYTRNLRWALENKMTFLALPLFFIIVAVAIWATREKEFMPSLDEGAYMAMPTSLPHAGITEVKHTLKQLDMAVSGLPEVAAVVGKAGRVESALDPAPLSMYENLIIYKPEFLTDSTGSPLRFKTDRDGFFKTRDGRLAGPGTGLGYKDLIEDPAGSYYRNWRPHIHSKEDIWSDIASVSSLPGLTSSPKLQPIETRLVMLQTGMRALMGIKIKGDDLTKIEAFGLRLEAVLKETKGVKPASVFADRIIGKPYIEFDIDRAKVARYGLSVEDIQEVLETAVGGKALSQTVEGRERYAIRLRYPRELRNSPEDLGTIYVTLKNGSYIPISELVAMNYRRGPQEIKSEDGFLVGYVLFDKTDDVSEVTAVTNAASEIRNRISSGTLQIPEGVTYAFSGNYLNQVHAAKRLMVIVPAVLILILLILYMQFRSLAVSLMVFIGIGVAFSGGFLLIWFYDQPWFMDFGIGEFNFRELFHIKTVNLSVAVWVGFIALFGIATDDGVVMATYLNQSFRKNEPADVPAIREAVLEAGLKRIRPCLMTTATTLLALLPILTSTGRGSDVMIPMAIPCFGGMLMALVTLFVVPVLYSWRKEIQSRKIQAHGEADY